MSRFAKFAWTLLLLNLLVILWGAVVRATGSGAGCGSHWPLCNGVVVPPAPAVETMIELFHRTTSGLLGLLTLGLAVWAWRRYEPGNWVRRGALAALLLVIVEGLLGAGLVLFELVGSNTSLARGGVAALHLANTLLLTAAYTVTAWWASGGGVPTRWRGPLAGRLGIGLLLALLLGVTGAVTALGATLFPAGTLTEGLQQDFSPNSPLLLQLRVVHPTIAVLASLYLAWLARHVPRKVPTPDTRRFGTLLLLAIGLELAVGVVNLALHAPVWLQLVHLALANLMWIILVLLSVTARAAQPGREVTTRGAVAAPGAPPRASHPQ